MIFLFFRDVVKAQFNEQKSPRRGWELKVSVQKERSSERTFRLNPPPYCAKYSGSIFSMF